MSKELALCTDCCRYEYALDNGYYNDAQWTLQTADVEASRSRSVRFLVWLDYMYSDADTDILRNFFSVCCNTTVPPEEWGTAWEQVFSGTKLEGKIIAEVWEMYERSDFAYLSSESGNGGVSELLEHYPVREKVLSLERH